MTGKIAHIQQVVCNHYNVTLNEMLSKRRGKEIVFPRQVAMFLCREIHKFSYPHIGRGFQRDYSTVIYGYQKVKDKADTDPQFLSILRLMEGVIGPALPSDNTSAVQ